MRSRRAERTRGTSSHGGVRGGGAAVSAAMSARPNACSIFAILSSASSKPSFELLGQFIVTRLGDRRLPGRKDDGVFNRGMMLVHADERGQGIRERRHLGRSDTPLACDRRDVVGDFAAALVLHGQRPDGLCDRAACRDERRKNMFFLERTFVIFLTEAAEQGRRVTEHGDGHIVARTCDTRGRFRVHEQCAAQHAMFAHEVLGGLHLLSLLFFFILLPRGPGIGRAQSQADASSSQHRDPSTTIGVMRHEHLLPEVVEVPRIVRPGASSSRCREFG
jgi:hypothetical protein